MSEDEDGTRLIEDASSHKILVATTIMQKEWVLANCLLAILFLLFSLASDTVLMKKRRKYYERMSRADRLWVLMNLNIVGLYILVVGAFKIAFNACVNLTLFERKSSSNSFVNHSL